MAEPIPMNPHYRGPARTTRPQRVYRPRLMPTLDFHTPEPAVRPRQFNLPRPRVGASNWSFINFQEGLGPVGTLIVFFLAVLIWGVLHSRNQQIFAPAVQEAGVAGQATPARNQAATVKPVSPANVVVESFRREAAARERANRNAQPATRQPSPVDVVQRSFQREATPRESADAEGDYLSPRQLAAAQ